MADTKVGEKIKVKSGGWQHREDVQGKKNIM